MSLQRERESISGLSDWSNDAKILAGISNWWGYVAVSHLLPSAIAPGLRRFQSMSTLNRAFKYEKKLILLAFNFFNSIGYLLLVKSN